MLLFIQSLYHVANIYLREQDFLIAFGTRLKEIRVSNNLTQEQLANECELPPSQIGRIERGEINTSISHIYRIAKALKVHPMELWDFKV